MAAPILTDLEITAIFHENGVNSALRLIYPDVTFTDPEDNFVSGEKYGRLRSYANTLTGHQAVTVVVVAQDYPPVSTDLPVANSGTQDTGRSMSVHRCFR